LRDSDVFLLDYRRLPRKNTQIDTPIFLIESLDKYRFYMYIMHTIENSAVFADYKQERSLIAIDLRMSCVRKR